MWLIRTAIIWTNHGKYCVLNENFIEINPKIDEF